MEGPNTIAEQGLRSAVVEFNLGFVGPEAILMACHWFSRDFDCSVRDKSDQLVEVVLTPKVPSSSGNLESARASFITSTMDFALRQRIEAKTSGIRDLLLAKAFSESGVLEDPPQGLFGDRIEEANPRGMLKILSNPQR